MDQTICVIGFLDLIKSVAMVPYLSYRLLVIKLWPFQNWVSAVLQGPRPYILRRQK